MAASDDSLSGPDLRTGIALSTLADGVPLLGHADGEPVLLVRRGDEVFAIGATCTHYGVSLADGLVTGEAVRCPAHHACFGLRTGAALRAPALNPVACWDVERDGDTVRVTGKRETTAAPSSERSARGAATGTPSSVVILGAGAAGAAAAEMLRREGFEGRVTLVGAEDQVPYDRRTSPRTTSRAPRPRSGSRFAPPSSIASGGSTSCSARAPRRRRLTPRGAARERSHVAFDALLLATGSDPTRLPIATHKLSHVHYLRTLADSRAIIARAAESRRAVVVGGSFIALEVAASLRMRGLEVHVVAPEAQPLELVLGSALGAMLRALHEEHGVVFHMRDAVGAIDESTVTLKSGAKIPADLVVAGIGVRPSIALAMWAKLEVEHGGVVVDEQLRTSAPGVYAAGDLTRWPDPRTGTRIRSEHWVVAQRQGQVAARNILGAGERFDAVPFFWSNHYDVAVRYVGHAERWDRTRLVGRVEERDCAVAFEQQGRTMAVATVGRDRLALEAESALERLAWDEVDRLTG